MERWGWALAATALAGCATPVSPLGPDTYAIAVESRPLTSLRAVQERAAESADDYCKGLGRDMRIHETTAVRVVFTCVHRQTFGERMDRAVALLVGQNARTAIRSLGYPTTQKEILGDTVLEWSVDQEDSVAVPTESRTSGDIGLIPYGSSTTGTEHVGVHGYCTLQLPTAGDGTIKGAHWSGNERGCAGYLQAIEAR